MTKFRISVIDFLPQFGQHETDLLDQHGKPLCFGACVHRNGERFLVGHRYGKTHLVPVNGMPMTICPAPGSQHEVGEKTEVVAVPNLFLLIGSIDEPIWQTVYGKVEAEVF